MRQQQPHIFSACFRINKNNGDIHMERGNIFVISLLPRKSQPKKIITTTTREREKGEEKKENETWITWQQCNINFFSNINTRQHHSLFRKFQQVFLSLAPTTTSSSARESRESPEHTAQHTWSSSSHTLFCVLCFSFSQFSLGARPQLIYILCVLPASQSAVVSRTSKDEKSVNAPSHSS